MAGGEIAATIAAKQQLESAVVAGCFSGGVKKILAEESVPVAVAIKVNDANAEGRSELRLDRERPRFEASAAIQEYRRVQPVRFEAFRGPAALAESLREADAAECLVAVKLLQQPRHALRERPHVQNRRVIAQHLVID